MHAQPQSWNCREHANSQSVTVRGNKNGVLLLQKGDDEIRIADESRLSERRARQKACDQGL